MSTFNGIGTMWQGISKPNASGMRTGTRWFTVFYLPVVPLSRHRFRYGGSAQSRWSFLGRTTPYTVYSKESLDVGEILTTYLLSWVICPLILVVPLVFLLPILPQPGLAGIAITAGILVWFVICIVVIFPRVVRRFAPDPPET